MDNLAGYDIRYSNFNDEEYLIKWLSNEDVLKWFPMSGEKEIIESSKNWIGFSKFKSSLTATLYNHPCGIGTLFLMPYIKMAHLAMFYIVVDPKHQNKGIGNSILKNLVNLAEKYFHLEGVYCEIFEGCELISLLKKFNFNECVYQEKFVKQEDGKYLSRMIFELFFKDKK